MGRFGGLWCLSPFLIALLRTPRPLRGPLSLLSLSLSLRLSLTPVGSPTVAHTHKKPSYDSPNHVPGGGGIGGNPSTGLETDAGRIHGYREIGRAIFSTKLVQKNQPNTSPIFSFSFSLPNFYLFFPAYGAYPYTWPENVPRFHPISEGFVPDFSTFKFVTTQLAHTSFPR